MIIVIAPVDKGNDTVFLGKTEYERKALDFICKKPFEVVKKDPTKKFETALNKHLWKLFPRPFYDRLHASSSSLPRFYR